MNTSRRPPKEMAKLGTLFKYCSNFPEMITGLFESNRIRFTQPYALNDPFEFNPAITACKLTIQLRPVEGGSEAKIIYAHTSLGPEGDAFVASFTEEHYREFMLDWEARINHYLSHGSVLRAAGG